MPKSLRPPSAWNPETLRDFSPNERYLIGVSGGRDSVALLHWLLQLGYRKLVVCHLDHRLRGRAATADASFVRRLAESLGLPFVSQRIDVAALAQARKQSIETAARAARFEFFAATARRRRCRLIFLGHHADDFVETFLLNLFRGGSGSMKSIALHTVGRTQLTVIRPLLGVWRREIDDYVAQNKLAFREDATNHSLAATRNRMRHRIIPFLEKEFGRDIRQALWRTAVIAADENALLDEMLPAVIGAKLDAKRWRHQPTAGQRRAIHQWLRAQEISNVSFELIESVRGLLGPKAGPAKVNLPGNRHARRRAGELFVD